MFLTCKYKERIGIFGLVHQMFCKNNIKGANQKLLIEEERQLILSMKRYTKQRRKDKKWSTENLMLSYTETPLQTGAKLR